jgi:hypothetical protein
MQPSFQNSLLLAVGLAVAASSVNGMNAEGGPAGKPIPGLRLPPIGPGEVPPRLVLLPQAAPQAAGPGFLAFAQTRTAGIATTGDAEAVRAAFRGRAQHLLAERLARERHTVP